MKGLIQSCCSFVFSHSLSPSLCCTALWQKRLRADGEQGRGKLEGGEGIRTVNKYPTPTPPPANTHSHTHTHVKAAVHSQKTHRELMSIFYNPVFVESSQSAAFRPTAHQHTEWMLQHRVTKATQQATHTAASCLLRSDPEHIQSRCIRCPSSQATVTSNPDENSCLHSSFITTTSFLFQLLVCNMSQVDVQLQATTLTDNKSNS